MSANDYQIAGTHYRKLDVQPWAAMEAWMPREQFIGFLRGNAIKYLARAGHKDDLGEAAKKAKHYLEKLIEVTEAEQPQLELPLDRRVEPDECPFTYRPGEEPPEVVHPVIGVCADCGCDAHIKVDGLLVCFPCAHSRANW